MSSGNLATLTLTVTAAAALAAARFVKQDGNYPAAGGLAFGVTRTGGAVGDLVPVDVHGTAIVECGGTITKDAAVMADASGKAVAATGAGKLPLGRAMEDGASGGSIEILLIPSNGIGLAA